MCVHEKPRLLYNNKMPKKPNINADDLDTFHQAMKGTKRLTQKKIRLSPTPPVRKTKPREPLSSESLHLHETANVVPVAGEEYIAYKQTGISHKILRKLRKGQYNVEAILDLHGMTVEKANMAVDHFLQQCLREGKRIVLIIHGKGHHSQEPILKNKLNHWLRNLDAVLAFCSAAPTHGSRGASYVMLKHKTGEDNFE
jgi:DNA-nicking Smr family endonuclease